MHVSPPPTSSLPPCFSASLLVGFSRSRSRLLSPALLVCGVVEWVTAVAEKGAHFRSSHLAAAVVVVVILCICPAQTTTIHSCRLATAQQSRRHPSRRRSFLTFRLVLDGFTPSDE